MTIIQTKCQHCGERFEYTPFPSVPPRRYCSRSCATTARARKLLVCAHCGKEFKSRQPQREERYCSRPCANRAKGENERARKATEVDMGYETPCFILPTTTNRYAKVVVRGKVVSWHRFMYEQAHGPIPPGMHLDHLCEVRQCGNPDHLEVVTPAENLRRSWQRGRHEGKRGKRM